MYENCGGEGNSSGGGGSEDALMTLMNFFRVKGMRLENELDFLGRLLNLRHLMGACDSKVT